MNPDRLLREQRHERLLGELRKHGAIRVQGLARDLGVSELTIRRDIAALAARNLVTRVYGGATLPTWALAPSRPRHAPVGFTVGMVVPSLDFYWPPVVTGARAAAASLGVRIQLRGSSYDPDEDRRQIDRLVEAGQVQGLLLAPSLTGALDWIGHLPVPVVLVERQPRRWAHLPRQVDWVRTDHGLGLEIAVHHLYDHGHRRLALLLSGGSPTSEHLVRGWRTACAELGLGDDDVVSETAAPESPEFRSLVLGLIARYRRSRVTAVVVHSDPHAIAAAQLCADAGVSVPGDLAIVSYDDEIAHLGEPALTAIRPPKNHVGRLAVELMVARLLDGDRRPSQGVLVAPELVVRQSSITRGRGGVAHA